VHRVSAPRNSQPTLRLPCDCVWAPAGPFPGCAARTHLQRLGGAAPHIPSGGVVVARSPESARPPLFIFAGRVLYGKTKKSTHGHTNVNPFCTRFPKVLPAGRAPRGKPNRVPQPFHRRLWQPLRPSTSGNGQRTRCANLYLDRELAFQTANTADVLTYTST
jgi:hypothetical protein